MMLLAVIVLRSPVKAYIKRTTLSTVLGWRGSCKMTLLFHQQYVPELPFEVSVAHSLLLQNAFSDKLAQFQFCLFLMLVVDLMHEFELGVWRAIFIHLLRILDCHNEALKHELDKRYYVIVIQSPDSSDPSLG